VLVKSLRTSEYTPTFAASSESLPCILKLADMSL